MKPILPTLHLRPASGRRDRGFTLIELLVVIGIIIIVLTIALPNLKGFREGHEMDSAARQLVADLSLARARAINNRTTVAVVFIPPEILSLDLAPYAAFPEAQAQIRQLQAGIFTQYALFSTRRVGDQPGCSTPRYQTRWVSLPDKTFIAQQKFPPQTMPDMPPFATTNLFPFPSATSLKQTLPYVAFNFEGRPCTFDGFPLSPPQNVRIPLARGGILYTRNADGAVTDFTAQETPAFNSVSNYHHVVIDWLTGKAKLERQEVQ